MPPINCQFDVFGNGQGPDFNFLTQEIRHPFLDGVEFRIQAVLCDSSLPGRIGVFEDLGEDKASIEDGFTRRLDLLLVQEGLNSASSWHVHYRVFMLEYRLTHVLHAAVALIIRALDK